MSILYDAAEWLRKQLDQIQPKQPARPRDLTPEDRAGWADAWDARPKAKPQTIQEVRRLIKYSNPIRWYFLQCDFKWVQSEMKKQGLNPEDARFVL